MLLARLRRAGFLPAYGVSPSLIEMFSPPAGLHLRVFFFKRSAAGKLNVECCLSCRIALPCHAIKNS